MELTLKQALQKGMEAHKAGNYQEADQYYTAILKENPKHSDANHNMGILAVGIGKLQEALPFFKSALQANPNMAQYWLSYINTLISLDRVAEAQIVLDQAKSIVTNEDTFEQIESRLGSALSKNSNAQDPSKEELNSLRKLYNENKLEQALAAASLLLTQFPKSVNLLNIIGSVHQGIGKFDLAMEAYYKALSIKPDYAEAYNNMAITLQEQGRQDEAIDAYYKALTIKPDYATAYYNIGFVFQDQGELDKAIEAYKKAISIKPDYAEAYINLGNVLKEQKKLDEAIEAFSKALSIKPDFAEACNNMATTFEEQGKLDEAIEGYTKALSIKPDFAEAIENASALRIQIPGTPMINKEFEKRLQSSSIELIEMPKFQIQQAIRAFLLNDRKLVRQHLKNYNGCTPSSIAKLKPKDQVFCAAYNQFLQKLIETPLANEPTFVDCQTVFHLGESHCLSYAHKKIKIQGRDYNVAPKITFGGKAYHFAAEKENTCKAITEANFHSLPDGSKVFLSFGEIDCRPNEGIISAAIKNRKPIEGLVSDTVRGYVDWFAEKNQSKNHSLFFFNVPAPIYNEKYNAEVNGKVTSTIKLFNSLLNKAVLDHDFNIIDVYKFTVGGNGCSNSSFHIDQYHLSSDAIPEIEKQISNFL